MERDLCRTMVMLWCAVPLASEFHRDSLLVPAMIAVASGLNPRAVSPRQAQRLMLLILQTAQRSSTQCIQ